jgi:hypothetical protein
MKENWSDPNFRFKRLKSIRQGQAKASIEKAITVLTDPHDELLCKTEMERRKKLTLSELAFEKAFPGLLE